MVHEHSFAGGLVAAEFARAWFDAEFEAQAVGHGCLVRCEIHHAVKSHVGAENGQERVDGVLSEREGDVRLVADNGGGVEEERLETLKTETTPQKRHSLVHLVDGDGVVELRGTRLDEVLVMERHSVHLQARDDEALLVGASGLHGIDTRFERGVFAKDTKAVMTAADMNMSDVQVRFQIGLLERREVAVDVGEVVEVKPCGRVAGEIATIAEVVDGRQDLGNVVEVKASGDGRFDMRVGTKRACRRAFSLDIGFAS